MTLARALRRRCGRGVSRALSMAGGLVFLSVVAAAPVSADAPPRVVVTAKPLALMVDEITQGVTAPEALDLVRLAQLAPAAMRRALSSARLVVWVGPFHRPRLTPVLAGQTTIGSLPLFDVRGVRLMGLPRPVTPGVKPNVPQVEPPEKKSVSTRRREISARDLHHKYPDPYIWLDPRNAIAMVQAITVRLSAIDPAHGRRYRRNSAALVSRIEALDQELQGRVVSMRKIAFVALDRSFQYFERQYDLEPKVRLHDASDPMTAQEATVARRKLAAARIDCVIMPTTAAQGSAIVKGLNIRVAWIDPYGRDQRKAGGYPAFLRSVADRFTFCLTGRRPPSR